MNGLQAAANLPKEIPSTNKHSSSVHRRLVVKQQTDSPLLLAKHCRELRIIVSSEEEKEPTPPQPSSVPPSPQEKLRFAVLKSFLFYS